MRHTCVSSGARTQAYSNYMYIHKDSQMCRNKTIIKMSTCLHIYTGLLELHTKLTQADLETLICPRWCTCTGTHTNTKGLGVLATSHSPTLGLTILKSLSRWVDVAEQNGFFNSPLPPLPPCTPSTFLAGITSNTHIIYLKRGRKGRKGGGEKT